MIRARDPRIRAGRRRKHMLTVIVTHDIDDTNHWLASPKRQEFFGPKGITVRTFLDARNPKRAAVLVEVPDMELFEEVMHSQEVADAMVADGVHSDTVALFCEFDGPEE
jgi:hypothetical protein